MMLAIKKWIDDHRGVAAVEFALIAPVLLLMWVGVVEITYALMAKRKAVAAAQSCADLVAQETEIEDSQIDDIKEAISMIFYPLPTTGTIINIASVVFDENGDPEIDWQNAVGELPEDLQNLEDTAEGLGLAGESVIIVTVVYTHELLVPSYFGDSFTFTERAYLKPRRSLTVENIE